MRWLTVQATPQPESSLMDDTPWWDWSRQKFTSEYQHLKECFWCISHYQEVDLYHSDLLQYQQLYTGRSIQFKTCSLVITSLACLVQIGLKESGNSWLADSLARNWINPQWCEMYPKVLMGLKSHCGAPKISQNSVSPLTRYSSIHFPAFEYHSCDLWREKGGFRMEERNGLSRQP